MNEMQLSLITLALRCNHDVEETFREGDKLGFEMVLNRQLRVCCLEFFEDDRVALQAWLGPALQVSPAIFAHIQKHSECAFGLAQNDENVLFWNCGFKSADALHAIEMLIKRADYELYRTDGLVQLLLAGAPEDRVLTHIDLLLRRPYGGMQ